VGTRIAKLASFVADERASASMLIAPCGAPPSRGWRPLLRRERQRARGRPRLVPRVLGAPAVAFARPAGACVPLRPGAGIALATDMISSGTRISSRRSAPGPPRSRLCGRSTLRAAAGERRSWPRTHRGLRRSNARAGRPSGLRNERAGRRSAGRTSRHAGDRIGLTLRMRIERVSGRINPSAACVETRHRGRRRTPLEAHLVAPHTRTTRLQRLAEER
jgi:hypothetical protein